MNKEKMELIKCDVEAALGIKTEIKHVLKNGMDCWGLSPMTNDAVKPVVYYDGESNNASYIAKVKELFAQSLPGGNSITSSITSSLMNPSYILQHTRVCVQRKSSENILKRQILNLEAYMRLDLSPVIGHTDSLASTKITNTILMMAGLTSDDLWTAADKNTRQSMDINSIDQLLSINDPLLPNLFDVITTRDRLFGASALRYPDVFRQYCLAHNTDKLLIIPSSIHELLIIDAKEMVMDYAAMAQMVADVNAAEVTESEQLDPVVYMYSVDTDIVSIVASAIR